MQRRTAPRRLAALVPATMLAFVAMGATGALADTGKGQARTTASDHGTKGTAGTSGDPTQKQPLSGADQNSGGANGQCTGATYCSTRDGSASGNGNGGGKATGKPCAGCVGKADNKNPPGQEKTDPSNTFPNNGYECDRNHGIGRTNPAHTGCAGSTTTTCPEGQVMGADGSCTSSGGTCPEGQVMGADGSCTSSGGTCPAGEVMGTDGTCSQPAECIPSETNNFCSSVEGEQQHRPTTSVEGEHFVLTPTVSPSGAGVLPFTGAAALTWLLTSGTMLLALGGALLALGSRRRPTS